MYAKSLKLRNIIVFIYKPFYGTEIVYFYTKGQSLRKKGGENKGKTFSTKYIKNDTNPRKSACPVAPVDGTGRPKHIRRKK